jgi:hypothetical protein
VYYFITDETNVTQTETNEFFIYGGLVLSDEQLSTITADITKIRKRYGFEPNDNLKFDTNSRPPHVTQEDYTKAKNDVIESCCQAGAKFIVYLIHHNIAQGDAEHIAEFALNSVLVAFNLEFLTEKKSQGIVIIDRLPDGKAYAMLRSKFQEGLPHASSGLNFKLDKIVLFATTCNGASHISSAVDIVLGGFRWVVNASTKPVPGTTERRIFQNIARMIYGKKKGDQHYVRDYGLILRPETIKAAVYRERYESLVAYLTSLLLEAEEPI